MLKLHSLLESRKPDISKTAENAQKERKSNLSPSRCVKQGI